MAINIRLLTEPERCCLFAQSSTPWLRRDKEKLKLVQRSAQTLDSFNEGLFRASEPDPKVVRHLEESPGNNGRIVIFS